MYLDSQTNINEKLLRGVFRGTANGYRAQTLNHDFTEGLARELVFNLGGHRVYGMTFSNWVMLMSLHKCARTMSLGTLRLHCLMWATERRRSRGWRREDGGERKKRRGGSVGGGLLYPQEHAYLPKMDSFLAPSLSMSHVSIAPSQSVHGYLFTRGPLAFRKGPRSQCRTCIVQELWLYVC